MNGRPFGARCSLPSAWRTAVPIAMNSARSPPHSRRLTSSRTATIPSAPSWSASSSMRVIASSRAWYIACVRTSISWFWLHAPTWKPMW